MDDQELVQEFLTESAENLARLAQDMVTLERQPQDRELLASVFRTIHTIKGTCGFLGFNRLEKLAHVTEDILSELRNGSRILDAAQTTLILQAVDAIKRILAAIDTEKSEGPIFELDLISRLEHARDRKEPTPAPPPDPEPAPKTQPEPEPAPAATRSPASTETTLRVDVGLLDR